MENPSLSQIAHYPAQRRLMTQTQAGPRGSN